MDQKVDKTLDELKSFCSQEIKVVSSELKEIIKDIAKTGRYTYAWEFLKPLFALELKNAMEHFLEHFPPQKDGLTDEEKVKELRNLKDEILTTLNSFSSAPFTIQRLSELVTHPRKHYKTCAKFYRGVLKNILVVSTVEPDNTDESPSKKIKLESNPGTSENMVATSNNTNHLPSAANLLLENGTASKKKLSSVILVPDSPMQNNAPCSSETRDRIKRSIQDDPQRTVLFNSENDGNAAESDPGRNAEASSCEDGGESDKENQDVTQESVAVKTEQELTSEESNENTEVEPDTTGEEQNLNTSQIQNAEPQPSKPETPAESSDKDTEPIEHKEEPMDQS